MSNTLSASILVPGTEGVAGVLFEDNSAPVTEISLVSDVDPTTKSKPVEKYNPELKWKSIIIITSLHGAALYGAYLAITSAKLSTNIWAFFMYFVAGVGISPGSHRLWSHRTYKAKLPLRVILMIYETVALQTNISSWVRDHRIHHKYVDTNADPYNAKRGFFFSHIGWLLCRKHPDVKEKSKLIDFSDVENDPVVVFQKKHYWFLLPLFAFILPTLVPMYFWDEDLKCAFFVAVTLRSTLTANMTSLVNSAAHSFGDKPYNKHITPSEPKGLLKAILQSESAHNYHHAFPWDYRETALGDRSFDNGATFIKFCAYIGWAYDLKTASSDTIKKRIERTGDGSHLKWEEADKDY